MTQLTPQKEVEAWSDEARAAYWKGFDEGCKLTFEFTGPHPKPDTEFFTCGPQHTQAQSS